MIDHIPDASKMVPWANEPTPLSCKACEKEVFTDVVLPTSDVPVEFAQNLERRMRAAERLLETATIDSSAIHIAKEWILGKYAHLKAAKKEDGR